MDEFCFMWERKGSQTFTSFILYKHISLHDQCLEMCFFSNRYRVWDVHRCQSITFFFSLPSPRLSSVLQTAGMFQNIFFSSVFFSVQGFTQGTGNTDWWLEYLQMATCTIVSFKSITMHGFIQRQYVLMLLEVTQTWTTCQNGNALWLLRMFWRQCSVCVLLLWGCSPLASSFLCETRLHWMEKKKKWGNTVLSL